MKQKIWKIFLLLPPLAALILEILPYGAVLIFGNRQRMAPSKEYSI